ncbi:Alpha/Beta hydrolase protein [Naviculisporaceae sp. PSN 640]
MADFSVYSGPSAEWVALAATLPPPPENQTIEEKKRVTNALREASAAKDMQEEGLHDLVTLADHSIPTRDKSAVEARTYTPKSFSPSDGALLPVYIHLHGGGFLLGTLSSEDAICSRIAVNANVIVLNVNYRHTPEFVYPTAWNDTEDATLWLHSQLSSGTIPGDPNKVVMGGISAGAWLTSSVVLRQSIGEILTDIPKLAGQVLMIPCVSHQDCYAPQRAKLKDERACSFIENADAPILPAKIARLFTDLLKVEDPEAEGLKISPGNAKPEQVKGLPPSVLGITGLDPLRDQGLLYGMLLADNGVPTDVHFFHGLPHGFRRYGNKLSESKRWDRVMEQGIKWALSNPEATPFNVKLE